MRRKSEKRGFGGRRCIRPLNEKNIVKNWNKNLFFAIFSSRKSTYLKEKGKQRGQDHRAVQRRGEAHTCVELHVVGEREKGRPRSSTAGGKKFDDRNPYGFPTKILFNFLLEEIDFFQFYFFQKRDFIC